MNQDQMLEVAKTMHENFTRAFMAARSAIDEINRMMRDSPFASGQAVDTGLYLRQVEEIADELRKEASASKKFLGQVLCVEMIDRQFKGESPTIKGEIARATGAVKSRPRLPKSGSPEYRELMQFFGVPEEAIVKRILQPSFREMSELLDVCAQQGKPIPKGLLGTFEEYECTFFKHQMREAKHEQQNRTDGSAEVHSAGVDPEVRGD